MSLRNAGRQSPILLAGILLFGAWVAVNVLRVYEAMPPIWGSGEAETIVGEAIGQVPLSGLIGLLVMLAILGLLFALYGALSEPDPLPDEFPPERRETVRDER
jgi:hypothetical protein